MQKPFKNSLGKSFVKFSESFPGIFRGSSLQNFPRMLPRNPPANHFEIGKNSFKKKISYLELIWEVPLKFLPEAAQEVLQEVFQEVLQNVPWEHFWVALHENLLRKSRPGRSSFFTTKFSMKYVLHTGTPSKNPDGFFAYNAYAKCVTCPSMFFSESALETCKWNPSVFFNFLYKNTSWRNFQEFLFNNPS